MAAYTPSVEIDMAYLPNGTEAHRIYDPDGNEVWAHPGPRITQYGASAGAGNMQTLTINRNRLPFSPTISGTFPDDNVVSWGLNRIVGAASSQIANGAVKTDGTHYASARHQENYTSDFRPDSSGWRYALTATDADADSSVAVCTVRTVLAPTLAAFTNSGAGALQGPGVNQQVAYLNWTGEEGDPNSVWTLTQSGRHVATLPSSRHLSAAQGAATGTHRTRIQVAGGGGGSTTLTLTARNDGGTVSRSTTINWLS